MIRTIFASPDKRRYKISFHISAGYVLLGHCTVKEARKINFLGAKFITPELLAHNVAELDDITLSLSNTDSVPVKLLTTELENIITAIKDSE